MRILCFALALLGAAAPARADRDIATTAAHTRLEGGHDGMIPETDLGARTHDVLGAYHVICPHTIEANPTVVIVLDPQQPLAEGEWIAHSLARHGYAAVLLHPGPLPGAARIAAMIDAVLAGAAATPDEPGCAPDGRIGLYGIQRGGALVLLVAHERELAGHPVDVVVATLASGALPLALPATTPALLIEPHAVEHGHAQLVVIEQLTACEVHSGNHPCWNRFRGLPASEYNRTRSLAVRRQLAIGDSAIAFVRGALDHDELALRTFTSDVEVRRILEPPSERLADPEYRTMYSVPLTFGATFGGKDTSGAFALRPEVLFLRVREGLFERGTQALGIGGYAEVARLKDASQVGAGLTLAVGSGRLGFAPSVGVARRGDETGLAGSFFVGLLDAEDLEHNDLATGVRIDARRIGNETTMTVSLQIDLALPVLGAVAVSSLLDLARR